MRENNLEPKEMCFVHANTKSAPSMVLVKAKKGASGGVIVSEPLFLNLDDDAKMLTERAKKIYEECNF
jgi:tRNA1(Val) A37 N6-methylase TrmN6